MKTTHETPSGQFIDLVNAEVARGRDYTDAWQFVRRNNPALYDRMRTEGSPKGADLSNSANATEIERLRAVISKESKTAVSLANALMEKCRYTFDQAWAATKVANADVHKRIADAQQRVMALTNAKTDMTPNATAIAARERAMDHGLSSGGKDTLQVFSPFGLDRLSGDELAETLKAAEKSGDRAPFLELFVAHVLRHLKMRGPAGAWAAWDASFQEVQTQHLPLFKRATGTPTT